MHPCLLINELLTEVIKYLPNHSSRLVMALACRAFYEPAMDALWACSQQGLRPLILSLPQDITEETKNGILITRAPLPHEWTRFRAYARRVKEFAFAPGSRSKWAVDFGCYNILREHHPGPIFPYLQQLEFYEWDVAEHAAMFITPTLRLLLYWPNLAQYQIEVMECVQSRVPELMCFALDDNAGSLREVEEPFNQTIRSLKNLTEISYTSITLHHDTWVHLSSLPSLWYLQVKLGESIGKPWTSSSWGAFRSLTELYVEVSTFEDAHLALFLDSVSSPILSELKVYYDQPVSPSASQLSRVLAATSHFTDLQSFSLEFSSGVPFESAYDSSILSPMFSLACMETFVLSLVPVQLSRRDLKRMINSWPSLEKLRLHTLPARIPLDGLVGLTHPASLLDSIHVELANVPEDWGLDWDGEDVRRSAASRLSLGRAHIKPGSISNVAAFLAQYFPLATVTSSHPNHPRASDRDRHRAGVVDAIEELKQDMVSPDVVRAVKEMKAKMRLDLGA